MTENEIAESPRRTNITDKISKDDFRFLSYIASFFLGFFILVGVISGWAGLIYVVFGMLMTVVVVATVYTLYKAVSGLSDLLYDWLAKDE